MKFRAKVAPDAYRLESPDRFYSRSCFHQRARAILNAYSLRNPDRAQQMTALSRLL